MALVCLIASSAYAGERAIDASASKLTVKVWKTGLFSAFAHDHEISAPITSGAVVEGDHASVNFVVNARAMKVLDPDASASTRAEVEHNMLSAEVLDTERYPKISFESTGLISDKIGGGAIKVKDEVDISFTIVLR